jgi:hypothetical protein
VSVFVVSHADNTACSCTSCAPANTAHNRFRCCVQKGMRDEVHENAPCPCRPLKSTYRSDPVMVLVLGVPLFVLKIVQQNLNKAVPRAHQRHQPPHLVPSSNARVLHIHCSNERALLLRQVSDSNSSTRTTACIPATTSATCPQRHPTCHS